MWLILQGLWYLAGVGLHVVYKLAKWAQGQEAYLGFRGTMEAYWTVRKWHIIQAGIGSLLAMGAWTSGHLLVPVNMAIEKAGGVQELPLVWWSSFGAVFAFDYFAYKIIEKISKKKV